jgi:dihydroneopterin aldolase
LDTIFVESIEFYAYHGASDEEQSVGHRYVVDVELKFDTRKAGSSDDLNDTVNYSRVAKRIVAIGTQVQYRLLEALAAHMAEAVLSEFPVEAVRLRVKKLTPPMNVIAHAVGVEVYRERRSEPSSPSR